MLVLGATNWIGGFLASMVVGLLWTTVSPIAGFVFASILMRIRAIVLSTVDYRTTRKER
jgi:hypothetical protein